MAQEQGKQRDEAGVTAPAFLESREHLEAILQAIAEGVVARDTTGRVVYANDAAARLLGAESALALRERSIAEVLARFDLFDETGRPVTVDELPAARVLAGAPEARLLVHQRQRDTGVEQWIDARTTPLRDIAGKIEFAVTIMRDVTDEQRSAIAAARLAAIVTSSDDVIIGKTLDAIITSWNPAAERLYGYSAAEAIGSPIAMLVPPERADELPSIMARIRAGHPVEIFESVRVRKDGSRVDVSLRISPVYDANGRIIGASTIARDITAAKRTRDALQLLAEAGTVVGASLEYDSTLTDLANLIVPRLADWCAIHVLDEQGRPEQVALAHADPEQRAWANTLRERFPYDYDEASGLMQVIRSGEPRTWPRITDDVLRQLARSPEHLEALRQLGFHSAVIVPLTARGRVLGGMTLVFAESGRTYGMTEIGLVQELARRAGLAIDNARLFAAAESAARAREDFLLTASHELRTPLTTVKAAAQLAARHLDRPELDRERLRALLGQLQGEVNRLETLALELLDAARIQRGRFELAREPFDLVELLRETLALAEQMPERLPSHTLVLDAPAPVAGVWDRRRLEQIAGNLVSNALKYSPAGGQVRVSVSADDGTAELVVSDQGIGLTEDDRANLFVPFARGAAVRQTFGGTGLGLYIAHQIIEAHGGTIEARGTPGQGSRFTVRLPRHPAGAG